MYQNILPANATQIQKALDQIASKTIDKLNESNYDLFAKTCKKEVLPHLAYLYDVNIVGLSENETRHLLSNAFTIKRYAGTIKAIKTVLSSFNLDASVQEWYEYSGKPYHFKIVINSVGVAYSVKELQALEKHINIAKNERSILEEILLQAKIDPAILYIGAASSAAEFIQVELKNEL